MDADILAFFEGHAGALPLYEELENRLLSAFPDAQRRVQKTQITFFHRHVFACASLIRVRRKADMPDPCLVVTLGLPAPLSSPRAAVQTQPYPGRWTVHIVIGRAEEIDGELMGWAEEAYWFSESKRGGRKETV